MQHKVYITAAPCKAWPERELFYDAIYSRDALGEGGERRRARAAADEGGSTTLPSFALTLKAVARTFAGYYLRAGEYGEMSCR